MSLLTNPKLYGGDVFDAVWVISPSVKVDSTWEHLRKYRAKKGQCGDEFFMDSWDEDRVKQIMEEGMKMTEYHKKQAREGHHVKFATSTLLVVDDMASEYHAFTQTDPVC